MEERLHKVRLMARPLRIERAGAWFHVTARGNERRAIYRQRRDYEESYRKYTEQALREGLEESPWEQLHGQVILGAGRFLAQMRAALAGNAREQPSSRRAAARPAW